MLYMYGVGMDAILTVPAGFFSGNVLKANAKSVTINCGDHGVIVPENLR